MIYLATIHPSCCRVYWHSSASKQLHASRQAWLSCHVVGLWTADKRRYHKPLRIKCFMQRRVYHRYNASSCKAPRRTAWSTHSLLGLCFVLTCTWRTMSLKLFVFLSPAYNKSPRMLTSHMAGELERGSTIVADHVTTGLGNSHARLRTISISKEMKILREHVMKMLIVEIIDFR